MIQLRARPNYYRMVLNTHYAGDSEILKDEYGRDCGNTSENEFTSDGIQEDEQEIEDSIEELVLMLNEPEKKTERSNEDQLMDEKLSHLNKRDAEAVKKIMRDYPEVISYPFEDVRPSTVSINHRFALTSENSIYQNARRKSPSHNGIVRKEIECLLAAGIITPVESSWTSLVVIDTKKMDPLGSVSTIES